MNQLLLVGEGSDDIGGRQVEGDLVARTEGVVEILLRRLLRDKFEVEPQISTQVMKDLDTVKGLPKKVAAILLTSNIDRIVVVLDRDARPERYLELRKGLEMVAGGAARCVVGLAIEMLEAWLLADSKAWKTVFGKVPDSLPARPEDLWGSKGSPGHPKVLLKAALEECHCLKGQDQANAKRILARELDLELLQASCSQGFGRLVEDIRNQWFPWI